MGVITRKRKYQPSSSSFEEVDQSSGFYSVDFFVASKDPYRVAPEAKIPTPWPYFIRPSSDEADQLLEQIGRDCKIILQNYGIHDAEPIIQLLCRKGASEFKDTLIIKTRGEPTTFWKYAATRILELINKVLSARNSSLKMRVEIRNQDKMYRDVSSVIITDSAVHKACLEIEEVVYQQVKKTCPEQWTSISYWMRGPVSQTENRKPTIIITAANSSKFLWEAAESSIQRAVDGVGTSNIMFDVEILAGVPQFLGNTDYNQGPAQNLRLLPPMPQNGSSIGPRGSQEAGSLGTFVNFQPSKGSKPLKCFLTCYHVVSPGDEANRKINDRDGIGLEGKSVNNRIIVDYPAPYDAAKTQNDLQAEIASQGDPDGTRRFVLEIIEEHVKKGGVGSVIYASGMRTNQKCHRMDWALVEFNGNTMPQNRPPAVNNFSAEDLHYGNLQYQVGLNEVVTRVGGMVTKTQWVAKIGRTTGASGVKAGEVNAMRIRVNWNDGYKKRETFEIGVRTTLSGDDWVRKGDSGSMVFNVSKEWVGMAWGWMGGGGSDDSYGLMTSADEIIQNIKELTGGEISLA